MSFTRDGSRAILAFIYRDGDGDGERDGDAAGVALGAALGAGAVSAFVAWSASCVASSLIRDTIV